METFTSKKKLLIKETLHSVRVAFNNETNILDMRGVSLPPNVRQFFIPIVEWTENYLKSNPAKTTLNISFKHLHSTARQLIFELIKLLKQSEKNGNSLKVNWYYEREDDDMMQTGMEFSFTLGMIFNLQYSKINMSAEEELKKELIDCIRKKEHSFVDTTLDDFSIIQLIIIKAGIYARINCLNKN